MAGDSYYAYTSHRFKQLKLLKFEQINRYLIGLFMYKDLNELLPPMFQHCFTKRHDVHDHYTRASGTLSVQYARTDYRRFSIFCKGPIIWNKIPSHNIERGYIVRRDGALVESITFNRRVVGTTPALAVT